MSGQALKCLNYSIARQIYLYNFSVLDLFGDFPNDVYQYIKTPGTMRELSGLTPNILPPTKKNCLNGGRMVDLSTYKVLDK